ncbi:MAG: glycosyltransferase family 4 protein [Deltaproteobacteria bacterium]|nr:glycosyltransferase family 4 protein [Deltaproteobacteria bacterium]
MKICIISNLYNLYVLGGAEINTQRLAKALSRDNEIFVVTTKPFNNISSLFAQQEVREGTRIYRFYPLNLYSIYFHKKRRIVPLIKIIWHILDLWNIHTFLVVLRILNKEKPDIIHTSNLDGLSFSVFWVAKFLKISLVHTLHDYHLLCPYANFICPYTEFNICKKRSFPCRIYSLFKRIIVDNIPELIITPSRFIIDMHREYGFFKKVNAKVIPYFIEIKEKVAREFDSRGKEMFDILYVGRLSKEKGIDVLIRSFRELKGNFLRLDIVGDGPENKFLKELAMEDKRVIFYGKVKDCEIDEFYKGADVVVVPSVWYENFPTVVLEAVSFGVPVIGSNIGGIPEQIQDGSNGFLIRPKDSEDLKQKIKIFIDDFKKEGFLLKEIRKNAHESSEKYSKDRVINELMKSYKECLLKDER